MSTPVTEHAATDGPEPVPGPTGSPASSPGRRWTGRLLWTVVVAFLALDGVTKVIRLPQMVDGVTKLGYPDGAVRGIGVVLILCLTLYVIPRTAVLGAILLTGYLGGAVATHVRIGSPLLGFVLLPVYVGVMLWGALYLRDARLRALIPFRSAT